MPAFYREALPQFLHTSDSELAGRLSLAYAHSGFNAQRTSQTRAWEDDILHLRTVLDQLVQEQPSAAAWTILLEFPIPRKEKRIDVVLLAGDVIVILELKTSTQGAESLHQAEEYALLLHYFHQPSDKRPIITFVVSPNAPARPPKTQQFLPIIEAPAYWIEPVVQISWSELAARLRTIAATPSVSPIDPPAWDHGDYFPVPTIIQAALSLQSGLSVREIAHSRAARHDVDALTAFVDARIEQARHEHRFIICFVTGVPGSGKTLVGLNLSFGTKPGQEPIHFMSGTGPLVQVLQAVLASHHQHTHGVRAHEARMHAKTLIENVHIFAKTYTDTTPNSAPSNHVIIFDEAQRAWDRAQNFAKFKRDYSEPEMLLKIMERHQDWAVVIALVGGGQEINSGEAGLAEWGRALSAASKPWQAFASPEALAGGSAVAGSRLFETPATLALRPLPEKQLHLDVSVRSLKADSYSAWVNFVVTGDAAAAAALNAADRFPILLTRSLSDLRSLLRENTRGDSRCGLVASSAAMRIRAEGLEPDSTFHGEYPWHHWYLAEPTDVRSSYQLEVFATEFEIQGLELDWIGVCWGGDFVRAPKENRWLIRTLRHGKVSKWSPTNGDRRQMYRRNAYRVILTRARQGVILYIPAGDTNDPTRQPPEFDATAEFLLACGARLAKSNPNPPPSPPSRGMLF